MEAMLSLPLHARMSLQSSNTSQKAKYAYNGAANNSALLVRLQVLLQRRTFWQSLSDWGGTHAGSEIGNVTNEVENEFDCSLHAAL